jgi:maltose O-acetyltransferase
LYNVFAKHLPNSSAPISLGAKRIRYFCLRLIIDKCGKNVNLEKGAVFSSRIEIGDNSGIGRNANIRGKTIIGENVMMGPDCVIYTLNHKYDRTDIPMIEQGSEPEKIVTIGNDV